jgi:hypothetical protein
MQPTLFYLIGFSGTGKYTIAQAISTAIDAIIIDNQLINMPVFTAVGVDGTRPLPLGVWREISKIREAVMNTLCYISDQKMSFILTNELVESKEDRRLFEEVIEIAKVRESLFVPVRLLCEEAELFKRMASPERTARLKCINPDLRTERLKRHSLLVPEHPNLLELDVTNLAPNDAAHTIINHAKRLQTQR